MCERSSFGSWATAVVAAAVVVATADGVAIGGDQAIEVGATARERPC